jgi:hypothetical protein
MTDYLFAPESFITGAGRTLDLGAQFAGYNESLSPAQADAIALYLDWLATGKDFSVAFQKVYESLAK